MGSPFIEHVNISVSDNRASAALFQQIFGWYIRWQGAARDNGHSIHVGDDRYYLALHTPPADTTSGAPFAKGVPLNHIGFVVDDLDALEQRVRAAGLTPFGHEAYDPGRRFYAFDGDGIEFEFISYA